jgi:fermentation-respiration switch protein FrsA (DUF1100 family)
VKSRKSSNQRLRYIRNLLLVTLASLLTAFYVIIPVVQAYQAIHPPRQPVCCMTPADFGFDYEPVALKTSDGLTLRGWYIPSRNQATVIVVHGYKNNRIGALSHGVMLARHEYGVLLFDLRAHGESEKDVFALGWESDKDVLAALNYLQNRPDVDRNRIGAMGLSTGAIVVLLTAVKTDQIKAVVSDGAGSAALKDALLSRDWMLAPGLWTFFKSAELFSRVPSAPPLVDSISRIAPRPVMLIASAYGPGGELAANRNYYAAAQEPKILWELSDAGHVEGLFAKPEEYEARVIKFFDQSLPK